MQFWRICRQRYASDVRTGEGARLYGGRWNSRGVAVVYASSSLALAAIETFVNLEPKLSPADLVFVEGEVPGQVRTERLDVQRLPPNWYRAKDESLKQMGDDWVRRGESVALSVPSAAIPGDWNILLNPSHADFRKIEFHEPQRFEFDLRMFP